MANLDKVSLQKRWSELKPKRDRYVETVMDPIRKDLDKHNKVISEAQAKQEPIRQDWTKKREKLKEMDEELAIIARALGRRGLAGDR